MKYLSKLIPLPVIALLALQLGCNNNSSDIVKLVTERDSLRTANQQHEISLKNYTEAIQTINAALDSMAEQEGLIFVSNGEQAVTKDQVLENISRFESVMKRQQEKIENLESRLKSRTDSTNSTSGLITHLKQQIEQKNAQIARLKAELADKNVSIAQLQNQVGQQNMKIQSQSVTITELTQRNQKQGEALARQDAMLNNGYVIIGSKDDLKRKGIIKKGKIVSELDRSKFAKVDIRKWREISFNAKRPRILTNMPPSSYQITTKGDKTFILTVTNPSSFWAISNYLVIQTD